jgi:HD superfamily phosphohydrolase
MECVAVDVLRAPEVQRLRRIRQLGLVSLVFPGAEHSRFTHSLGAAHVMKRFANALVSASGSYLPKSLQPEEEVVRDLIVAALCHDLGHGPLSHAWEQQVVRDFDRGAWMQSLGLGDDAEQTYPWLAEGEWDWHELVTQALLLGNSELREMLEAVEKGMSARVAALLAGHFYFPYLAGTFASDVDADRCDFVLRDAVQTGVAHGRYDLDWLVSTIAVGEVNGRPVLGFDKQKAPRVIEQLLVARRALYEIVYWHSAVRAAEGMVGLLLGRVHELATANPTTPLVDGFEVFWRAAAGIPLSVPDVIQLDEDGLWIFLRRVAEASDPKSSTARLFEMVRRRELFKPVPLKHEEITQLALTSASESGEGWNRLDDVLRRNGYNPPAHFRFLDQLSFAFFHEGPPGEGSWLIDLSRKGGRRATPVSHEESLVHHHGRRESAKLFVPRDVVGQIVDAWEKL